MSQKRKQHSSSSRPRLPWPHCKTRKPPLNYPVARRPPHDDFRWKRQLLDGAAELFDKNQTSRKQIEGQVDELYRQIGQLKVENDFLARKLGS